MRRLIPAMLGILATACEPRPERPPLEDFPAAADDTAAAPVVNDCTSKQHAFTATSTGYLEAELAGFGTFDRRGAPEDLTSIYLQACRRGATARTIVLNGYASGKLRKTTYPVDRLALESGGFDFSFVDSTTDAPLACDDAPSGTVTITRANDEVVEGSFEIEVRCRDFDVLDEGKRPQLTFFSGTFAAGDVERR